VGDSKVNKLIRWQSRKFEIVLAGASLLICLLACYCNSFDAGWHYDDFANIIDNPDVRMTELTWSQLIRALNAGMDYQTISRPLAYLSFALNYRFGQTEVFGYHVVNFIIHWLTAVCLYLFTRGTLRLPIFKGRYETNATIIAWLATVLWAVHPIQVTATTYIVQRMASMAGLLYILAMYLYLRGRQTKGRGRQTVMFCTSAFAALGAVLTKENAVLLVPAILLYEAILLRGFHRQNARRALAFIVFGVILMALIGLLYTDPATLLEPYSNRPFSKLERLMTQPRVLFFYASLLTVPMTSRMTILHDVAISHSLVEPWTTLLSIIGCCSVLFLAVRFCRRYPLVSYSTLFFLINHSIEGSIFNLELAYEHRNYIPSMLLFIPLAVVSSHATTTLFHYNRLLKGAVWMAAACMIISFGFTTYTYNRVFNSEISLWLHGVDRAPFLSVTHNNLGKVYWGMGLREQAQAEFNQAYELDRYFNFPQKGMVFYNLGLYAAYEQRDHGFALDRFQSAKKYCPGSPMIWYETARMHLALGHENDAAAELNTALAYWPQNPDLNTLSGLMMARQGRCDEALQAAEKAIAVEPLHLSAIAVLAGSHQCKGNYAVAIDFWKTVVKREPKNLYAILALIELYDLAGDNLALRCYLNRLIEIGKSMSLDEILEMAVRESLLSPYIPDIDRIKAAAGHLAEHQP
jgi:tetratricopeptide (TPR) repeat protein